MEEDQKFKVILGMTKMTFLEFEAILKYESLFLKKAQ